MLAKLLLITEHLCPQSVRLSSSEIPILNDDSGFKNYKITLKCRSLFSIGLYLLLVMTLH